MFDLVALVKAAGYLGLFGIVFAESGLLIGFFLPGDSLLFTAGILASQGYGQIVLVIAACFLGAVLGDSVGYAFGRRVGPAIFRRNDSIVFNKDHIERARAFYAKYGAKTIVLARFIPVVRTFAPVLAGVGEMPYTTFLTYNIAGGLLWGVGMPLLGYYLGSAIPDIDRYLVPGVIVIVILSVIPPALHFYRDYRARKQAQK